MDELEKPREGAGPACPECGAPREADHTPSCACGPKAADALQEARTAQAAAAEDFDPLRIRPYVALEEAETGTEAGAGTEAGTDARPAADARSAADADAAADAGPHSDAGPQRDAVRDAKDPAPDGPDAPDTPAAAPPSPETTMVLRAAPGTAATSVVPTPLAPPASTPNATDLRMFEPAPAGPPRPPTPAPDEPAPRRRRAAVIGAAAAAVVVLGTAGYAAGLFSYESPARTGTAADGIRPGVPDPSTATATANTASAQAPAPSASASPSPSASGPAEASPSPSASASSASASASATTGPSASAATTAPEATASPTQPAQDDPEDGDVPVLRRGDRGPEVTELQQRLRQLHLYMDDIDGDYGRRVEDAVRTFQWARGIHSEEPGTYGPLTRAQLERETREP
ncbi:peptidoglycan-binding domain-containing protein [Streptomyces griseoviridis]|uniref:Peptidoglycan binding-like domain-containing protein n=1 Tax=Streptomyces griseoviridis TaxID=45398 RepID=A0ABT9LCQ6_STRGD|nr:peptidoglycan-binding domain-containing protein [Streptomyces griseoviridis]MDP9681505.1 hypothetical protein [Streptomyces griseoviridis]GGS74078.1 peptidoglycan-binding protein [Streptomyces griseoviridis]